MWRPSDNLTNDITLKYNERLRFHMQKKITQNITRIILTFSQTTSGLIKITVKVRSVSSLDERLTKITEVVNH